MLYINKLVILLMFILLLVLLKRIFVLSLVFKGLRNVTNGLYRQASSIQKQLVILIINLKFGVMEDNGLKAINQLARQARFWDKFDYEQYAKFLEALANRIERELINLN